MDKMENIKNLLDIIAKLRNPEGGCPWDLEQTHHTLLPYLLEEAHEYYQAVLSGSDIEMQDELGDVLLQVVLHAQIAKDRGSFNFEDVCQGLSEKLIRRHPHVFGGVKINSADEVSQQWQKIKASEKQKQKQDFYKKSINNNSALLSAQKIGEKSAIVKFDWSKPSEVLAKVEEELSELKHEIKQNDHAKMQAEMGDLLFSVVQLARHLNIDAESALKQANLKFINRFNKMHELISKDDKDLYTLEQNEKESYWIKVKQNE
jgi:MazG family protein